VFQHAADVDYSSPLTRLDFDWMNPRVLART